MELYKNVAKGKRPAIKYVHCKKAKQLIEAGWSCNPGDRPSFFDIRQLLEIIIKENAARV